MTPLARLQSPTARRLLRGHLGLVYVFLYLPILIVMVLSFNESRLATLWSGFSTRWYGELLDNARLLEAAGHVALREEDSKRRR